MTIVGRAKYIRTRALNFETTRREGSARKCVYFARPTIAIAKIRIAIAKIRDYSQSSFM